MTNFNCACPDIQRGHGSGFLSEGSSWLTAGIGDKYQIGLTRSILFLVITWAATWQNQQNGCASSEDSDQPGHPFSLIRVFAVRMKKPWVLSYPLSTQWRLWSDWVDAKADLSLRWVHTHFVGFVMSWLVWSWYFLYLYMHASPYIRVPYLKFVIGQCVSNMSRSTTNLTKWPVSKHSDKPGHPPRLISLHPLHEEALDPKLPI